MTADIVSSRKRVVREAANLIYQGEEKEYKQAKLKAAKTFGLHYMPTNLEVALEIDKIAEEREGQARQDRLLQMRNEALRLMTLLRKHDPLLVGSVWRGTIHRQSDLDIIVNCTDPGDVLRTLQGSDLKVGQNGWVNVTKQGKRKSSFHIHAESPISADVEIIVHSPDELGLRERCEVYGDEVVGLRLGELGRLLARNPSQRFVPST